MLQRVPLRLLEEGFGLPPFREGLLAVSFIFCLFQVSSAAQCNARRRRFLTLIDRGDCGITSNVAKAGALVSPALISPPSPLDFLRDRVVLALSLALGPEIWPTLSWVVMSCGKASVAGMVRSKAFDQAIQGYSRQGGRSRVGWARRSRTGGKTIRQDSHWGSVLATIEITHRRSGYHKILTNRASTRLNNRQ